jgi:hypothetical protein
VTDNLRKFLTPELVFNWRAAEARVAAYQNLMSLGFRDPGYVNISLFLRGPDPKFRICEHMTEEDIKRLEPLSGPHGLTILKAGLLRRGLSLK